MSTLTQHWLPTKSRRLERSIRLTVAPAPGRVGIVFISTGKEQTGYYVQPIANDFGTAYLVEKFSTQGREQYHVCLDGPRSSCECPGFLHLGRCKHVSGLQQLRDEGKL